MATGDAVASAVRPPEGGWTALIDELREGRWIGPDGAACPPSATRSIVIA